MNASDTLKVRKVRFFVEPKAVFFVPTPTHAVDIGSYNNIDGYSVHNFNVHNISTINFGVSGGLSIKLSKYFRYEVSLTYNHYSMISKEIGTYYEYSNFSGGYNFDGTINYNTNWDLFGIGNGISFTYKKLILSMNALYYLKSAYQYKEIQYNNIDHAVFSQTAGYSLLGKSVLDKYPFWLKSFTAEPKIGYRFLKNKIESYIGVYLFLHRAIPYNDFSSPNNLFKHSVFPFASIRVNF